MDINFNIHIEDDGKDNIKVNWDTKQLTLKQKLMVLSELTRHILQDRIDKINTKNPESLFIELQQICEDRDIMLRVILNCIYGTIDSIMGQPFKPKSFVLSILEPYRTLLDDDSMIVKDTIIVGDLDVHDPLKCVHSIIKRVADCMLLDLDMDKRDVLDLIDDISSASRASLKLHIASLDIEEEDE